MSQPPPAGQVSAAEILPTLHATFRQLDFWIRQGYVSDRLRDTPCGSGYSRGLTSEECRTVLLLDELVHAGLSPAGAADVARQLIDDPAAPVRTGPVTITVDLPGVLA